MELIHLLTIYRWQNTVGRKIASEKLFDSAINMILKNKNILLLSKNNHSQGPKKPPDATWGSNPGHLYFTSMNPNVPGSIPTSGGFCTL